eukprot:ANDGO_02375.mRNA.1 Flagellar WD repeat-containing protein Pf20
MSTKLKETYVLEEVDFDPDDDDDDVDIAAVDVPSDAESDGDDTGFVEHPETSQGDEEDFESMVRSLQKSKLQDKSSTSNLNGTSLSSTSVPRGQVSKRPEVVDDFIRNFLIKSGMMKTLDAFQSEWYDAISSGKIDAQRTNSVPDIYLMNQALEERILTMETELNHAKEVAQKAKATWDKFRKERDFHRMHHRRVVQEKNKLVKDIQRLQKHYENYEPTLNEMKRKYELAMKEKMLTKIERDKIAARADALEASMAATTGNGGVPSTAASGSASVMGSRSRLGHSTTGHKATSGASSAAGTKKLSATATGTGTGVATGGMRSPSSAGLEGTGKNGATASFAQLPADARVNPYLDVEFEPTAVDRFSMRNTRNGAHSMAIANVAIHPRKPVVATVSDDTTWKLWSLPGGELIMSGEGHKDWVSGCDFHPRGTHLATSSGDGTIKIWDFASASCVSTFADHSQAVWSCAFHDGGDFLVSGSLDHTAKLWDVQNGKCRTTLRGHLDSVNHVTFQPFSNLVCTASGDKTVSVWDCRSGMCIQTFYGHQNAVNHVSFALRGDAIASADADGVVKIWDARMVAERCHIFAGPHPSNKSVFDRSGAILVIASDDGKIKVADTESGNIISELSGHEDAVQAVAFDKDSSFLVSAGADCSFRYWSM